MACNEYMNAFTYILGQFWIARKMNKWGVQRHFEPTQMVPSIQATLEVISAPLGRFREKNMIGPRCVQNAHKTAKNEGCYTRFRTFPGSRFQTSWDASWRHWRSFERTLMAWNEFKMLSRSFQSNFGLHEKLINRVFRGILRQPNRTEDPDFVTSNVGTPRKVSVEKYHRGKRSPKCS